jgi:predicted nuclease of predicted toxin-antitoxin system
MVVRFKLDENLPGGAAALLRGAGHDVHTVLDEGFGGAADSALLDACRIEGRVLVTFDMDFSDLRLYPPADHKGIWVLRPYSHGVSSTLALLRGALGVLESESAEDRLWIVEPEQVRIRD